MKTANEQHSDSGQVPGAEWYELCAHASVWLCGRANFIGRTYFYREDTSPIAGSFTVGFKLGPFFNAAPERFLPHTDLPQRIRHWVANL